MQKNLTEKGEVINVPRKTVILLSDLHIGLRRKESKRTNTIFGKIAETFPGAPVLITGDLTDSAKKSQFNKARELLDELSKTNPILAVPGNHDYAWKGNVIRPDGWENWVESLGAPFGWERDGEPWMGAEHEPVGVDGLGVCKDGPCVYFGIDSGDPNDKQISARGYISKGLAKALKESLEKYEGKTRIVFLHHHPFTTGFFTKLYGSNRLLEALRGNCELLLFGHQHEYGIWWGKEDVPLIVSSHKSTDPISGDFLLIGIIDIENAGTPNVVSRHRLEML